MNFILFDPVQTRQDLLPLTYTRPIADCRVGIMTIREKWERYLSAQTFSLTESYMEAKFAFCHAGGTFINGAVLPTRELTDHILALQEGEALTSENEILAFYSSISYADYENIEDIILTSVKVNYTGGFHKINHPYDIFKYNGAAIAADFDVLTQGKVSQPLSSTNTLIGDASRLFIEEGASIDCATLHVKDGPIYIGRDAEIMEGCHIRGPFSLGDHAALKMGAKIYGGTTIGPHCRAGGEVSNSVIFGYSNKGHDGFLGHSVIGEWCNLGADTNVSNLKNNYDNISVWNYRESKYMDSALQFHGLIMGDHSKSGINTMFNTGTVVGVSANIFGSGFPDKFIPSFTWGGAQTQEVFKFDKAMEVAIRMMDRRGLVLTPADVDILKAAFTKDAGYRKKFNK